MVKATGLIRQQARLRSAMVLIALVSLPVILLDESNLAGRWDAVAHAANWLIWLAFAAESGAMLALSPARGRWARHHPLELAIVLLTPPFLPASLQAARAFRVLLALRPLAAASVVRTVLSPAGLHYAGLLAVVTVLGGGTAFAAVEHRQGVTPWDGVWWAIVTATTVGYGDITPKTNAGRVIAILVMIGGIGLLATLLGAVAQRFVAVGAPEPRDPASPNDAARDESSPGGDTLERKLDLLAERLDRLERAIARIGSPAAEAVNGSVTAGAESRPGGASPQATAAVTRSDDPRSSR